MANQQTLNILVVDSEEEARLQLKDVLTEQGFGVTTLSEPFRAPDEVRQNRFQLIVLDVSPGSGGTEARRDPRLRRRHLRDRDDRRGFGRGGGRDDEAPGLPLSPEADR